ncbi:hypothetical protein HNR59_002901 [Aquamicrobium lusatiense]|uniref:Uncharacterized protein n=1 Tax=Aquamicrobium lusatiense TaxID=89772 RepID=A0A7W9S3P5_9HYPH|nr:hypothetical protein [Aquamicrobium lusatiense]MBB6013512.1 hypothetical protein [Aquamicrobium lusatiense]
MTSERFEPAIRNAIAKHRAETREQRERIYQAARASFQRSDRSSEDIENLNLAIEKVESSFERNTGAVLKKQKQRNLVNAAILLFLGVFIGSVSSLIFTGSTTADSEDDLKKIFIDRYNKDIVIVPDAIEYLREITDAIVDHQRNNRDILTPSNKTFVTIAKIDPDLAKRMPKTLPQGTQFIVKADHKDFKVLANWTLCGAAMFSNPEMLDPVRSKADRIGCPNFGMWTPGAVKW